MFSVSITHHSKIKELSNRNRVVKTKWWWCQTDFKLWVPPFLSYKLWKLSYELWKLTNQTPSYAPRSLECVFHISSDKENWLAHILAKYTNGLFECHEFGNVFGFEELEIQILCSNKLKELDLDLAPNPTRIWLAKIHRFQIPLNTVEFLKSFTHSPLSLYLGPCFSLFLTMQQASSSLSLVLLFVPHNATSFFFSLFRDNL